MRYLLTIAGIAALSQAATLQPSEAAPFCLVSPVFQGMPQCTYQTWQQCLASIGGGGDGCELNLRAGYVFDLSDPSNPRVVRAEPRRERRRPY
jgi:hypothetical protein